jgi:PTH1 family peptidyl-tRNA hydrolase
MIVSPFLSRIKSRIRPSAPPGALAFMIVGLGNPGPKYACNRHNVGYQCIAHLAQQYGLTLRERRFKAAWGEGQIASRRVLLVQPTTFMNESGQAVGALARWFKIPPDHLLVVYDDLDLPLGKVRLRPNGSSGGHKGIASLIAHLGSQEFARLRIGIGRPTYGDPIDYVLGDFDREQAPVIAQTLELCAQIIVSFLENGVEATMNVYNSNKS